MTKKGIFILLPIVLVAAWVGSSWHIGKQIEEKCERYSTSINQFLGLGNRKNFSASGSAITSAVKEYKRGIFSSHAIYEITFGKETLSFDLSIEHGPLPLSQLTKFRFSPSTVGHLSVRKSALIEALFDNKGKFPAALNFIGYRDRLELNLFADYKNKIAEVRGATLKTSLPYAYLNNSLTELQKNSIEIVAKIKNISFTDTSSDLVVKIDNFAINYQRKPDGNYNFFTSHADDVSFKSAKANVNISKIELSSNMHEQQEHFSRDLVIKSGKVAVNGKQYGELSFSTKISNLDKRTGAAYSKFFNKVFQDNNNQICGFTASLFYHLPQDKELVSLLLKSGTAIDVDLNWELQGNNSSYITQITFQEPTNKENPLSIIKTFTAELKLPIKTLKLAVSNAMPDVVKEQIDTIDRNIYMMTQYTPWIAFDDKKTITSTLTYQGGSNKIILNGKKMTDKTKKELNALITDVLKRSF